MPLPRLLAGATQGHVVEHHAVVADLAGLADHHTSAVVNEEASTNPRARVNLNAGEKTRQSGEQAGYERNTPACVQPMRQPIEENGV